MVNPGDTLKKDQPVLELETDKATIEVPSSIDGVVTEVKVKVGQKVKVTFNNTHPTLPHDAVAPRRIALNTARRWNVELVIVRPRSEP